jgi:hypothetical protein
VELALNTETPLIDRKQFEKLWSEYRVRQKNPDRSAEKTKKMNKPLQVQICKIITKCSAFDAQTHVSSFVGRKHFKEVRKLE